MLGSASASRPEERESQLEKPGGALPNGLSVLPYDLPLSTTAGPHKNEGAGVLEITSELRARAVSAEQRAARLEEALKESRAERERLVENVRDLTENLENERLMTQLAQEESRVSTEAVRQVQSSNNSPPPHDLFTDVCGGSHSALSKHSLKDERRGAGFGHGAGCPRSEQLTAPRGRETLSIGGSGCRSVRVSSRRRHAGTVTRTRQRSP